MGVGEVQGREHDFGLRLLTIHGLGIGIEIGVDGSKLEDGDITAYDRVCALYCTTIRNVGIWRSGRR